MFEAVADAELIDVMGEATRDESTAIAQRLAAVGELYARRAAERAECQWWSTDATDQAAAEVSAVQNISHARAVGQVHYARTLCERLPALAKVSTVRGARVSWSRRAVADRCRSAPCRRTPQPDEAPTAYPDSWKPREQRRQFEDQIDDYIAKLSARELQLLLARTRGPRQ